MALPPGGAGSPRPFALVTGTSSGIGEALARDLLARGWRVAGVARREAPITDPAYSHLRLDVGNLAGLSAALDSTIQPWLTGPGVSRVGLVNNAALPALLGPMDRLDPARLLPVYQVNTAAPILLMGWFVRHSRPGIPLRIVNVSTGAAVKGLPGLGAYGNTKAALRLAGMALAAELDGRAPGEDDHPEVSILSYEPGLVDTPMQEEVRNSPAGTVPIMPMFKEWAATGVLVAPSRPAGRIASYLSADGYPRWMEERFDPGAPEPPEG
jgi:benzil reductase ((S)-benzoin forming)